MVPGKGVVEKASRPDQTIAFCDPAGLPFIQHYGPQMAGGASGALYAFLGIRDSEAFPDPVRQAVTTIASAKYHQYGMLHCIHTVGPNFNMGKEDGTQYTREEAIDELATAYRNVLREFAMASVGDDGPFTLRLLPISGGIFAGPFQEEIATLTMEAISAADSSLEASARNILISDKVRVELCVFMENEYDAFLKAHTSACSAVSSS